MKKNSKNQKRSKVQVPPLSVVDRLCYIFFLALIILLPIALCLGYFSLEKHIAFRDADAIATSGNIGVLLSLPGLFTLTVVLFIPWVSAFQKRAPIWGIKKSKADGAHSFCTEKTNSEFLHIKAEKQRKLRFARRTLTLLLVALVVLSFLPAVFSFGCGYTLQKDGALISYGAFHWIRQEYTAEEISSAELDCRLVRRGFQHYDFHKNAVVFVSFTYADGRQYSFRSFEFRDAHQREPAAWLLELTELKEQLDPSVLHYQTDCPLSRLAREQNLTAEESAMLYALFGQTQ